MKEVSVDIEKIMNLNNVEKNLVTSSLYLTAFEMLKISIVDDIKEFFSGMIGTKKF